MKANQNSGPVKKTAHFGWAFGALAIAVFALIVNFLGSGPKLAGVPLETTSEYQAVFLNNGQVYFGKLSTSGRWLKLTDVYYLQVNDQPELQATSTNEDGEEEEQTPTQQNQNTDIKLIKLGSELHGPEDAMYVGHEDLMFWENMKSDSKVMQAIKDYQGK